MAFITISSLFPPKDQVKMAVTDQRPNLWGLCTRRGAVGTAWLFSVWRAAEVERPRAHNMDVSLFVPAQSLSCLKSSNDRHQLWICCAVCTTVSSLKQNSMLHSFGLIKIGLKEMLLFHEGSLQTWSLNKKGYGQYEYRPLTSCCIIIIMGLQISSVEHSEMISRGQLCNCDQSHALLLHS